MRDFLRYFKFWMMILLIVNTPHVGKVAQWKKSSTNSSAWFWDIKETQNCYIWKKSWAIMEIAPDTHSQFSLNMAEFSVCVPPALHYGSRFHFSFVNLAIFERNFWLCTTSPPLWLKISFHFWQFWVPFISQNHNQAVKLVELFFPLSYSSNIGWLWSMYMYIAVL